MIEVVRAEENLLDLLEVPTTRSLEFLTFRWVECEAHYKMV